MINCAAKTIEQLLEMKSEFEFRTSELISSMPSSRIDCNLTKRPNTIKLCFKLIN